MQVSIQAFNRRWVGILLFLSLLPGCSAGAVPNPAPPVSIADLTADQVQVKVTRAGGDTELQQGGVQGIQVNDVIQVNEQGLGVLRVGDGIQVELWPSGKVRLADLRSGENESYFLRLDQASGHLQARLTEGRDATLVVVTEDATITTLEPGTAFVICYKPGTVTCGSVLQGQVEFFAQGEKVIAREGDAVYVLPGAPPTGPICAQEGEFQEWLTKRRSDASAQSLSQLVASWPQVSCEALAQITPTPAAPALPSAEGMVRIEAGQYLVGSATENEYQSASQMVELAAYWIDQYETTMEQYNAFLAASGRPTIQPAYGEEGHPAQGLTWDDAAAYCTWANKRLPTEAEWEAAGRGPGEQPPIFPWGNNNLAGEKDSLPWDGTYPVGTMAVNRSLSGVYDLIGNVWEWVGTPYDLIPEDKRILRGGRFSNIKDLTYREVAAPNDERFVKYAGVRCAADQVQGDPGQ